MRLFIAREAVEVDFEKKREKNECVCLPVR
jgi:hypothetical protein